ncbi:DNA gyrase/topoisomerase IV subunit A [Porphyromonas macacae]|uniref:DNA gyrase/topoisomerase IV subunit A n=1 Tax=Porphyromonas macacae TaxID=28115 RepID=UPI0024AD0D63|nr:DNA gyrase/topoisomerase IV subunit A [Porphyromonas macacae]
MIEDEMSENPLEDLSVESDRQPKQPMIHQLSGMYQNWFLDYASYVILERAVPHIEDGLKPVQRRVLYAMKTLDNGRRIKVAKIVGAAMAFHPHGDTSINDALVQLGQKGYLIDTQGNWGNILTGDDAAAGRYIEARLSQFALEVVFNDQITKWKKTYDGSTDEPIALPLKFPLLLAQGAEGIAVGLSSKILSHNFNELCDACCLYLKGQDFKLYPDFPTGGLIDVSRYNDGERSGTIKSRALITKIDNRTLSITELPAGKNTSTLIESILKANEKGKIKIKKVDDMTASTADIRIHLAAGTSSDKTIDALYAFTDCEVSISPNACVIYNDKPVFTSVSEILKFSADRTRQLLHDELKIRLGEKQERYLLASLERIFIEERIYKDKAFEDAKNEETALAHIDKRLEPWKSQFIRPVTNDDLKKLLEIRMASILKFNIPKHEEMMLRLEDEIAKLKHNIEHITEYTIKWFEYLKDRYGHLFPRMTQITNFDTIEATKVAELDEKLYINRHEGFVGTSLRNDEFVCNVSVIDDIIIFFRSGKYMITKVEDKKFIGKEEVIHIARFEKTDDRTIYNVIYRDGKHGAYFIKRFNVTSMTRDKEYDLTPGKEGSKIIYFTANMNGEAEIVRVRLKRKPKQRIDEFDKDFSGILIKSKAARGNLLTKNEIKGVSLKAQGSSTLGGRSVWFDPDINRINYNEQGRFLGEFYADDRILVILKNGECYTTDFNETNHYEPNIRCIEKFIPEKVWTAIYYDAEQKYHYLKRFRVEEDKRELIMGETAGNYIELLTDKYHARFEVLFGGEDEHRKPLEIDADEFIGVKSVRAKGKRLTTYRIDHILECEPLHPDPEFEKEKNEDREETESIALNNDEDEEVADLFKDFQ